MNCTLSDLPTMLTRNIYESQIYDRIISPAESRFFHNKAFFTIHNLSQCYSSYFSPDSIINKIGWIGLVLYLVGAAYAVKQRNWSIVVILVIMPLILMVNPQPLRQFQDIIITGQYLIGAGYGLFQILQAAMKYLSKRESK